MTTSPFEIFGVAVALMEARPNDQAAWRSVISRCYYSVYHLVGVQICPSDYTKPPQSHLFVKQTLQSLPPATAEQWILMAKRWLPTLKTAREDADYDLAKPYARQNAEDALQQALAVFVAFDPSLSAAEHPVTRATGSPRRKK